MKQILFIIVVLLMFAMNLSAQKVVMSGNTFKMERDTIVTKFKFEDSKGKTYPIIYDKGKKKCYVCRISKNGKFYRQWMKPEVNEQIINKLKES